MSLCRIASCLDTNNRSHATVQHARYLMELQRVFMEAAPSALKAQASVGNCKGGALVLLAHNGAVAAKLQQVAPTLLSAYEKLGFEVTKVRIAVQPIESASLHFKKAELSRDAAKALARLASETKDPLLKAALARLSERSRG